MNQHAFNYLTGRVNIQAGLPEALKEESSLHSFYLDPNNPFWGAQLCRVLYHESIHFWQLLSSGYIADLVAEEWLRLQAFEQRGEVQAVSEKLIAFNRRSADGAPFSAYELTECWARYWDVHTRSPAQIIKEEGISVDPGIVLERPASENGIRSYSGQAFDTVMQQGADSTLYAAPYRWMLAQARRIPWSKGQPAGPSEQAFRASVASSFVALVFPILAHAAFGSPRPVEVFISAFQRALDIEEIRLGFETHQTGNINFDWLNNWSFLVGEAVNPVLQEMRMPLYTSGLDVIARGPLNTHPVFREYLDKFIPFRGALKMEYQAWESNPVADRERWAIVQMPLKDIWVVFGLPGQPNYRYMLGRFLPPPAVQFMDECLYASRPITLRMVDSIAEQTFQARIEALEQRLRRFRAAEYAVSVGLPANAFET